MVLTGLRTILSGAADMEVVGEANTIARAIEVVRTQHPDVVMLGVPLAGVEVVSTVKRLMATSTGGPPYVIAMCSEKEEAGLLAALRVGLRGVVSRNSSAADLLRDVRIVAAGNAVLTPTMTSLLIDIAMRALPVAGDPPPAVGALTNRELEVLRLVAQGLSDAEIAEALWVSKMTVRSHIHHVLGKLGLSSRSQAVAYYYQHGLVGVKVVDDIR